MKTMKIMKRLMGCAAAILALSACSESEDLLAAYHSDSKAVHITAQVGKASADGFTRSNPLGTAEEQAQFNENDEISVKADGQDAVTYKLVGSKWEPQGSKFLKWEKETMNFTAYYPASYGGVLSQPKSYPDEASLIAADYMSFNGDVKNPGDNSLTLTMKRKMARVVVEIVKFNDQYAEGTKVNSVTINGDVKAYKQSDNTYYALMVPCEAETTKEFLSLEVGDNNAKETLTGIPALEAGKSYTYQLTVGKNKISVSGITVKDWTTGTITGGKAERVPPYLTFKADGEQKFKMNTFNYTITGLQYSVNGGDWKTVEEKTEITFGGPHGDLRLRGTNPKGTAIDGSQQSFIAFTVPNVNVACTGDIRTLLDWGSYKKVETKDARFCYLFNGCSVLTSAPELPATTLAEDCYQGMFYGCTNLESAPELPATTLIKNCYDQMFSFCKKLSTVTILAPSTEITGKDNCVTEWLNGAGTKASSRILKVQDAAAYTTLESNLPDIWKKDAAGTTVLNKDNGKIE